jgi:hypothetical protein
MMEAVRQEQLGINEPDVQSFIFICWIWEQISVFSSVLIRANEVSFDRARRAESN